MSDTSPNPAIGNGTRQQPGNAVCRHWWKERLPGPTFVCLECWATVKPIPCKQCHGNGKGPFKGGDLMVPCFDCNRTGVARWEVVK